MIRDFLRAAGVATVALAVAAPLRAQAPSSPAPAAPLGKTDTTAAAARVALDASADSATRALARALSDLAVNVQRIVAETANKPEVRLQAVQVANRALTLAQRTLAENAGQLEKLLGDASRELARAEATQRSRIVKK